MFKLWASIKKEFYLLVSDKVGLVLMFVMPLLLVFVITIIQDSAFKLVNENKISILIVNHDRGSQGTKLIELLKSSGLFEIEEDNIITSGKVKDELLNRDKLIALYISSDFSLKLNEKAGQISNLMMEELGLKETSEDNKNIELPSLTFYHDPVLQENYCYSLISIIYSFLDAVENSLMIENFYLEMGFEKVPENLKEKIISNKVNIIQIPATSSDSDVLPNSTQHNVPAWTIFAMFFMVVSLGNNIVKERINGSFIRLKTMPTNFFLILASKMIIYLVVAILQVALIFSAGVLLFPFINLPQLVLPSNIFAFGTVVLICGLSAVSYALMIGSIAKTQEQANGFGAVSIIIFAALGGIWVPVFVMPEYLQFISNFSPLHWCLEGFYILFLKGGNWAELFKIILPLFIFIVCCQLITYLKLRVEKII